MNETQTYLFLFTTFVFGIAISMIFVFLAFELYHRKKQTVEQPFLKGMFVGFSFFGISILTIIILGNLAILSGGCSGMIGALFLGCASLGFLVAGPIAGIVYIKRGKTLLSWKRREKERKSS